MMSSRQGWRRARSQTLGTSLARYRTLVGRAALSRDVPRLERFAHRFMPRPAALDRSSAFGRSSSHRIACGETVLARASFNYSVFSGFVAGDRPGDVEDEGIEPSTLGLQSQCSPAELIPRALRRRKTRFCARGEPSRPPSPTALQKSAGRTLKTK
jgi:hypothetical protein